MFVYWKQLSIFFEHIFKIDKLLCYAWQLNIILFAYLYHTTAAQADHSAIQVYILIDLNSNHVSSHRN